MGKTIALAYGPLSDSISEQLDQQGFKYDKKKADHFEKQRDAIYILRFAGLITDSVVMNIENKLHKKIVEHVAKQNGKEVEKHHF